MDELSRFEFNFFNSPEAPPAVGPYSQAVAPFFPGTPMFLSGQIGLDPKITSKPTLVEGGIEPETRQVIANIRAILAAAGLELSDIASMDVFLADIKDYPAMNNVYAEEFGEHKPARTTVGGLQLPFGARVEMRAIAWLQQV